MDYLQRYRQFISELQSQGVANDTYVKGVHPKKVVTFVQLLLSSHDFNQALDDYKRQHPILSVGDSTRIMVALPLRKKFILHSNYNLSLGLLLHESSLCIIPSLQDQRQMIEQSRDVRRIANERTFSSLGDDFILFTIDGKFLYLDEIYAIPFSISFLDAHPIPKEEFLLTAYPFPQCTFNINHSL